MRSNLPKPLHLLVGKPVLEHVLDTASQLAEASLTVVLAKSAHTDFTTLLDKYGAVAVEQSFQGGTGHACKTALPGLGDSGSALILYGDVPLLKKQTLEQLLTLGSNGNLALLTMCAANPTGYGRIVRDSSGNIDAIVEEADASAKQRRIDEVSTGIMVLPLARIGKWLEQLDTDNAQSELYLTDVIAMARREGLAISSHCLDLGSAWQAAGINTFEQLAAAEKNLYLQRARQLMEQGVRLADPMRIDLRGELRAGEDIFIDINTIFSGEVKLGNGVTIGAGCTIEDSVIGNNVTIKPYTLIESSHLEDDTIVGPFARLRYGTRLQKGSAIGNFVETKNSDIGKDSKANHLSYIGDTVIGKKVNVGAGVITCNFDGKNKHKTVIEDNAFIGSNTTLVAPLTVGRGATTAAGSAITRDVPEGSLSFGRARQIDKEKK